MNKTSVFVGCSFTKGEGLVGEKDSPDLWVNQLHQSVKALNSTTLINLGISGNSNETIFQNAVEAIATGPAYLFVSWTSFPRLLINPGVEINKTEQLWSPASELNDIQLHNNIIYTKKYLTDVKNRFFNLLHDHHSIVKILEYSTAIKKLCLITGTKVFFINAILPWDLDYFVKQSAVVPSDTTKYTQQLLDVEARDDENFLELYNIIHSEYSVAGCPGPEWVNLYQGFKKNFMLDLGTDEMHPGPISNKAFSDFLIKKILL